MNTFLLPLLYKRHAITTAAVTVWGVIAYNTRSPQVLIHGTMMIAQRYVHDTLQPHVLSLMQRLPGATVSTCQMLGLPRQGYNKHKIVGALLLLSLNLSPIKHIWDYLGLRVGYPTSLIELEARLQQIWNEMSQHIIQNLFASMLDRIASCIRARGCSTGY
ncbi:transposable element Tcb1 transposase [Trichonephila clavipes]|nr:transposable element Tcb1 transposase [Trichonephila clavipes]